ncbi:fibronectin type III domain-containing protein [Candidatus Poriferisodalis sp.]|uniref:fibronectin type III domain-containing protein n=1 Tax=Candidatus Poriferisodalis sp. TaxID=3101277 RepID=UPI003B01E607
MAALSLVLAPTASAGATEPVESPPEPPTGLLVDAAGDGITVSWQAATTGTTPTGYKVRVNPDCGARKTKTVAADTLTVTFGKVKHCDTYKVWVKAQHSAGSSDKLATTWQRPQAQGLDVEPVTEAGPADQPVLMRCSKPSESGCVPIADASNDPDLAEVLRCFQNPSDCEYAEESGNHGDGCYAIVLNRHTHFRANSSNTGGWYRTPCFGSEEYRRLYDASVRAGSRTQAIKWYPNYPPDPICVDGGEGGRIYHPQTGKQVSLWRFYNCRPQ